MDAYRSSLDRAEGVRHRDTCAGDVRPRLLLLLTATNE